jgi:hypothetical protein
LRKKRIILLLALLPALLLTAPLAAQKDVESAPLIAMLGSLPNTRAIHESIIGWADLRVADEAAGLPPMTTRAAYELLRRLDLADTWLNALPVYGLPPNWPPYLIAALDEGGAELNGFELFDIDYTLYAGDPPAAVVVLRGRFEAAAIDRALTARGFTATTDADGITVWCGPDGCESGLMLNVRDRNPANLFGGHLGRREPMALAGDTVLNSPDITALRGLIAAYRGQVPTLADDPAYRAAADHALRAGHLRQALFIDAQMLFPGDPAQLILDNAGTNEEIAILRQRLGLDGDFVPVGRAAELMAVTDHVDTGTGLETASLVLVYADAAVAQTAHDELARRLAEVEIMLLSTRAPLLEMLESRGLSLVEPALVTDEATGRTLLVLALQGELLRDEGSLRSGWAVRLWVDMIYRRDLVWLY